MKAKIYFVFVILGLIALFGIIVLCEFTNKPELLTIPFVSGCCWVLVFTGLYAYERSKTMKQIEADIVVFEQSEAEVFQERIIDLMKGAKGNQGAFAAFIRGIHDAEVLALLQELAEEGQLKKKYTILEAVDPDTLDGSDQRLISSYLDELYGQQHPYHEQG